MPAAPLRPHSRTRPLLAAALVVPALLALGGAPPASADVCIPIPGVPCLPLPGGPEATTPTTIAGSPRVDLVLTATEPVWSDPSAVTTYQWQRDGAAIVGATEQTYTVKVDDVGAQLTVVATGTVLLLSGTSTSQPVLGLIGQAPTVTKQPSITGTARAGSELTAVPGTWSGPAPTFGYQWYRTSGASAGKISGATDKTYAIKAGEAGSTLAVVVSAEQPGHEPGRASASVAVAKRTSTTTLTLASRRVAASKRAVARITLTSPDGAPTGTVRISDAGKRLVEVEVGIRAHGVLTVTLPRLAAGKHPLRATYVGTDTTAPSTSKKAVLTVTR